MMLGKMVIVGHSVFQIIILPTRPLRGPPAPRGRGGVKSFFQEGLDFCFC